MRPLVVVAFWLFAGLSSVDAGSNPPAGQLLLSANQQRDIFHEQADPFQLDLDFTAQMNVPMSGHYTLRWAAKDRWWSKMVFGGYEEIQIQDGEWTYTARNATFTPIRVRELRNLIRDTGGSPYIGTKVKDRVQDRIHVACVQAERKEYGSDAREICIDSGTHDVLSERWDSVPDEKDRVLYSDYFDYAGRRYPRRLTLEENASRVIKADVTGLVAAPFDPALLTPPNGAIRRRHCPGMKSPMVIKQTPLPTIGTGGDSTVALTILTDGSVGDVQLEARGGQKLDQANLATLKQWKFKPAMCGTEPVVTDIEITTSVREQY